MIKVIEQDGNILHIQAIDKLTHADYEEVLIPLLDKLLKEHSKARILLFMGEEFHGWEAAAMWDDAKFGMMHRTDFDKCAVVGGPKWVEWATKVFSTLMSGECKTFPVNQLEQAQAWLRAPVQAPVK